MDSEILNKDIESLNKWALANHMIFNQPKCKVVSNTRKNKIFSMLPFYNFPYVLSGVLLDHTEYEKDLGVYTIEDYPGPYNRMISWQKLHKDSTY